MSYEDLMNLNVVGREMDYSKVVDYIEFVVRNSYEKNSGRYHEYLTDYSEAVAIITMFTDCKDFDMSFNDVMKFIQSDKWAKIKDELGDTYINFHYYVKKEIEYANTPLRFADNTMRVITNGVESINTILSAINVEALKNYDWSKILDAVDMVNKVGQNEDVKEQK